MECIQTYTGLPVYPLQMNADDVSIVDIAHSLSLQCRFGGHCNEFYSVAQHSVHVAEVVSDWLNEPALMLEALLHDAAETYLLDLPRPVKHTEELAGYRAIEKRIDSVVRARFGLPDAMSAMVRRADEIMLATEAQQMMKRSSYPWKLHEKPISKPILPWSPQEAERAFLSLFQIATTERRHSGKQEAP